MCNYTLSVFIHPPPNKKFSFEQPWDHDRRPKNRFFFLEITKKVFYINFVYNIEVFVFKKLSNYINFVYRKVLLQATVKHVHSNSKMVFWKFPLK
jgi:hypothetical protein